MSNFTDDELLNLMYDLETNEGVTVSFKTKRGHIRDMLCTRNLDFVPIVKKDGVKNPVINGPKIIAVYDYQNSDWRAIRKDSIISWDVVNLDAPYA